MLYQEPVNRKNICIAVICALLLLCTHGIIIYKAFSWDDFYKDGSIPYLVQPDAYAYLNPLNGCGDNIFCILQSWNAGYSGMGYVLLAVVAAFSICWISRHWSYAMMAAAAVFSMPRMLQYTHYAFGDNNPLIIACMLSMCLFIIFLLDLYKLRKCIGRRIEIILWGIYAISCLGFALWTAHVSWSGAFTLLVVGCVLVMIKQRKWILAVPALIIPVLYRARIIRYFTGFSIMKEVQMPDLSILEIFVIFISLLALYHVLKGEDRPGWQAFGAILLSFAVPGLWMDRFFVYMFLGASFLALMYAHERLGMGFFRNTCLLLCICGPFLAFNNEILPIMNDDIHNAAMAISIAPGESVVGWWDHGIMLESYSQKPAIYRSTEPGDLIPHIRAMLDTPHKLVPGSVLFFAYEKDYHKMMNLSLSMGMDVSGQAYLEACRGYMPGMQKIKCGGIRDRWCVWCNSCSEPYPYSENPNCAPTEDRAVFHVGAGK